MWRANATHTLSAGTYEYDSVNIQGALVLTGATTILTDTFQLNGVIHGFGRGGADGADARMIDGIPRPPGNGLSGSRGHNLTIHSGGLMELFGNIVWYGGNGGHGGDVNTQLMSAPGGRGGNGGTAGSLYIQDTSNVHRLQRVQLHLMGR